MYILIFRDKAEIIQEYFVRKKTISIGSDEDSDICVVHKMVSPKHCEITELDSGKLRVTDLKSTFGVFVNKKRINSAEINYGDTVTIGPFELDFFRMQGDKTEDAFSLLCISGKLRGKKFLLLKDGTKIGRDPSLNDIVISELEDTLTSRRHATISKTGKDYFLSDKRSKNRTRVNRETIAEEEERPLKLNDEIVIGKQTFRFAGLTESKIRPPSKIYPIWLRVSRALLAPVVIALLFGVSFFLAWSGVKNIILLKKTPAEIHFTAYSPFSQLPFSAQPGIRSPYAFVQGRAGVRSIFLQTLSGELSKIIHRNFINPVSPEIFFSSENGEIFEWDKPGGLRIVNRGGRASASNPAFSDFNRDGVPDTVIHADDSRMYIFDGKNQDIMFKSEILGQQLYSSPEVVGNPKTGMADIITCTTNGLINFVYRPLFSEKIVSIKTDSPIYASPVVSCSGGKPQVIVVSAAGTLYVCDEKTGTIITQSNLRESVRAALQNESVTFQISATPAVGDINGDGREEVVLITDDDFVIAADKQTGKLIWKPFQIEPAASALQSFTHPSCVLTDIDGDGLPDIAALSTNGKVCGVKGNTGGVLLTFDAGNQRLIASPALADINKDGRNELIFTTESGELYVLNFDLKHKDNLVLFYQKISNKAITSTPLVADFDGDTFLEIAAVSADNNVTFVKTNVQLFVNQVLWQGSKLSSGAYKDQSSKLYILNFAAIAVAVLYIAGFAVLMSLKKSRRRITWIG